MSYGITTEGFIRKHLQTIKEDLETALKAEFGDTINLASDSVFGKIVGTMAQPMADLWSLMEDVYNAMYPSTGSGVSLDNSCDIVGVVRNAATRSEVTCALEVIPGVTVTTGSIVATNVAGDQFQLIADCTPVVTSAVQAKTSVNGPVAPGAYTITINGTPFTYTAIGGDTPSDISLALETSINAGAEPVTCADQTGGVDWIDGDIGVDGQPTPFSIVVTANMQIDYIAGLADFESVETGEIIAFADTLTVIVTPINNWISCINHEDAELGDEEELDSELRVRRARSLAIAGASVVEAIRASLLDITDVDNVRVLENITDVTDGAGLPPHSFEAIVKDGDGDDIGAALWADKPAGIATYGSTTVQVYDSEGILQTLYFSRPTELDIYIIVEYHKLASAEGEIFPSNGEDLIAESVLATGQALDIGNDVIQQRFFGPIYIACTGIETLTMKVGTSAPPSQTTPFAIGDRQIAIFDSSRITITEV